MSAPHEEAHGAGHGVRSEEDRISTPRIVAVGIGSLVVFFLAGLAASVYLSVRQGQYGPVPIPPDVGRSKIGIVETEQFDLAVRGQRDRAARLERLHSFGWVDRAAGVAHVPIDVAMDLAASGVRPAAAPREQGRIQEAQP